MKGSIFQRVKERGRPWTIALYLGRDPELGKPRYKWVGGFRTKRLAEEALPDLVAQVQTGTVLSSSAQHITLGEFLDRWLREYAQAAVRPATLLSYRSYINTQIAPAIGSVRLRDLSRGHLQRYYVKLLESGRKPGARKGGAGLSPKTIHHHHRLLVQALGHAVEWGLLGRNVARLATAPRVPYTEVRPMNKEQVNALLDAATDAGLYYPLIHLAVHTGLRRAELLGLRWSDVDLDARTLRVVQTVMHSKELGTYISEVKTAKSRRVVTLTPSSVDVLWEHRHARFARDVQPDGLVFSHPSGTPLAPDMVSAKVQLIAEKAGLGWAGLQTLRHTHATLLLGENVHLKVVQERLGHSNISTTANIYSHVLPHMQSEAAEKFEEALL